jgi:tetratricopeptide (TPR) repeat protein
LKPKRHQNHILENESNKFFNNHLPLSWFVDKPENDYGIDYITNIVINNEVTGLYFSVQLKAKEFDSNTESVNIQFKTSTLNFYKSRLEPVLIVAFVRQEKEAYWTWFDNLELCEESLANKETYYVKVPKINKLTTTDWSLVTKKVQQNASIKYLIEEFSRLDYENLDQSEILAWKNYFLKNHTDSIFFFKKSLEKDIPNNKNLLLQGIAHSLYEMFNYNEALIYINKSIDIDPSKSAYLMKACILAEQGISTYNKSKLLSAKEIFKNFLDSEPNKPIYHFNYANTLQHLQEYNLAIEHFEIAIKLNPKYAEAWNNLGMIYYHLHDHDKEIQCYDKAIEIKPNLYQALFSKGVTYSLIYNRYDEGLELMLNSIKTNEDDLLSSFPRGYYYIAQTYYKKNDFLKAL